MKHRTFAWLALGVVVVAGNTALLLWMERDPGVVPRGGASRPRPQARAAARPPTARETALAASLLSPEDDARPRHRVLAVDSRGAPVSGAVVRIEANRGAAATAFPEAPLGGGTTGPDGVCEVVLARRGRARVVVKREGWARTVAPVRGPEARVVLEREGVISGRVVEQGSGDPVAGARVVARLDASLSSESTSSADGSFAFRGLPAGRWAVEASSDRNPPSASTVEIAAGEESPVEIRLRKGFTLRGRVIFAGTDRTADEGTISSTGRTAALGPGGRFVLSGLPGPVRNFRIETGGDIYRAGGQAAVVDPATGEQVGEIQVPLPGNNPSGLQYLGIVRDESGRPVEGARVLVGNGLLQRLVLIEQGTGGDWHGEGRTDAEGRYRVVSEHGGREILLTHPDYAPTFFLLPVWSRNRGFDLELARGATVLVLVTDEAGRPAAGAEVYTCMRHPDAAQAALRSGSPEGHYGDVQESLGAHPVTDSAGAAILPRMGAGSWYLCARTADGLGGGRVVLEIGAGTKDLTVDLACRRLPSIAGRVVDRAGGPVPGVAVSAVVDTALGEYRTVTTGPDGRFRMDGLLAAPEFEAAGFLPVDVARRMVGPRPVAVPLDGERDIVIERE